MEKLEQYRQYVQQVIKEYAQLGATNDEIEQQLIFDTVGDHYQLMYVGWKNRRRQHGCVSLWILKIIKFGYNMMGLKLVSQMS